MFADSKRRRHKIAALAAVASLLLAVAAAGHLRGRSYCTVRSVPGGVDVEVITPTQHLREPLGLASADPSDAEIRAAEPRIVQQLGDRIQARTASGVCGQSVGEPRLVLHGGERSVALDVQFFCPPGEVILRNTWRLDVDPWSETLCAVDGEPFAFRAGEVELSVGRPPTLGPLLLRFAELGWMHVLLGLDHVLFVVALLLAAAHRQDGEGRLRQKLGSAAGLVSGFALGHSITLIASAYGAVRLSPEIVEPIIALSLAVIALENIFMRPSRWRALTAAGFGLFHGFGFAGALSHTELPARGAAWSLLAFNLGVEVAQLTILLLLFPGLLAAGRQAWYRRRVLVPVSALIAVLGVGWFVQRLI